MKVLERKEHLFKHECTCRHCESRLEIETNDICWTPPGGDMREHWPESFFAVCAVCAHKIVIAESLLSDFLKEKARSRSRRSVDPLG